MVQEHEKKFTTDSKHSSQRQPAFHFTVTMHRMVVSSTGMVAQLTMLHRVTVVKIFEFVQDGRKWSDVSTILVTLGSFDAR